MRRDGRILGDRGDDGRGNVAQLDVPGTRGTLQHRDGCLLVAPVLRHDHSDGGVDGGPGLSNIQSTEAPHRISECLQASLYSRDLVNRACRMLMERHGLGHEQALRQLMPGCRLSAA
jgi:hypothetical protein